MSAEYALCLTCYEVYDPSCFDRRAEYNVCPRMGCNFEMVLVDENMIPIITILNQKGYKTKHCCSGHMWDKDQYIDFQPGVTIPTIPKGYCLDSKVLNEELDGELTQEIQNSLRPNGMWNQDWSKMSRSGIQKEIFNNLINLLEWAEKLPKMEEILINEDR